MYINVFIRLPSFGHVGTDYHLRVNKQIKYNNVLIQNVFPLSALSKLLLRFVAKVWHSYVRPLDIPSLLFVCLFFCELTGLKKIYALSGLAA